MYQKGESGVQKVLTFSSERGENTADTWTICRFNLDTEYLPENQNYWNPAVSASIRDSPISRKMTTIYKSVSAREL